MEVLNTLFFSEKKILAETHCAGQIYMYVHTYLEFQHDWPIHKCKTLITS